MESDKNQSLDTFNKNQELSSFFEKDSGFVFVYKKTEKLASAVYMITNLFSDNEPMKWTLRKKVSELVSFIINYKDSKSSNHFDFVHNSKVKILEFVSLLEISQKGNLISEMNFSILKQEFVNLINTLETTNLGGTEKDISKSFFDVSDILHGQNQNRSTSNFEPKRFQAAPEIKDKIVSSVNDGFKRTNRQNIILGLIKKKKEVTIKDIAEVIKDCSEKTIQRELISFMATGIIKRTGERRWSKYSLA